MRLVRTESERHDEEERPTYVLLILLLLLYLGVMNNSEQFIVQYFHDQGKEYTLVEWGTTVSCYGVGGLIGAVLGPKVLGRFVGRRATLLINNVFLIASSLLIALAPQWWYQALGRVFVGIVAGIAT